MSELKKSDNLKYKRISNRITRLEILKLLPDAFEPTENDSSRMNDAELEKLSNIVLTVKQGKSYIQHLKNNREFSNPENIQKVIDQYRIEEIGSNLPGHIYNPYNVVSRPEEYYDGIIRKQNEILLIIEKKK